MQDVLLPELAELNKASISISAIIVSLITAIATVIATKLFDILLESRKHEYNLKKELFTRKIIACERAVGQSILCASAFHGLEIAYRNCLQEGDMVQSFNGELSQQSYRILSEI